MVYCFVVLVWRLDVELSGDSRRGFVYVGNFLVVGRCVVLSVCVLILFMII